MQMFEVRNSNQVIRFDGVLLAAVTSARPHAPRFTVLELYGLPSTSPSHVFHRIGRSMVFHTGDCPQAIRTHLPYGHEILRQTAEGESIANYDLPATADLSPCQFCAPSLTDPAPSEPDFFTVHRFELARHFAQVVSDPAALVRLLTTPDSPLAGWLSTQLLNVAATADAGIAEAFTIDLRRQSWSQVGHTPEGGQVLARKLPNPAKVVTG
jgi:hypothetical protein